MVEFDFNMLFNHGDSKKIASTQTKQVEPTREIQIRYKKFVYMKDCKGGKSLVRVKKRTVSA